MKISLSKDARGIVVPQVELVGPKSSIFADLILDTGAAYTMVSWDTAITLGYDPARQTKSVPIVTAVEVSGLLGLSFLKHFRTVIDYRRLTLEIR